MKSRLFLLLVLHLLFSLVVNEDCTPSDYPPFGDQFLLQEDSPSAFDAATQFLVPGYRFLCEGRISQWEVYVTAGNGSHPVEFTVWRLKSTATGSRTYSLIGSNYFRDAAPTISNLLSLPVDSGDEIEVQAGDIAGVRSIVLEEEAAVRPFQIQLNSAGGGVITYPLNASAVTPQALTVLTSQLEDSTPVLRATVNSTVSIAETQPTTTPTETSSFPLAATVVAVLVGVLFLVMGTVIAVAASCIVKNRCLRSKQVIGRDGVPLSGNTVYGNLSAAGDDEAATTTSSMYSVGGTVFLDDEESGVYYSTIREL